MNKSDSIGKLAAALAKAQAQMEPAKKDTKGNFGKFADLGEVIDTIRKVSTPNGLSFSQFPVGDSAGVGVSTILMHESGEWLSDTIYLPSSEAMGGRNGAQLAGGNITYLRRYALASVFGVYADEDTDGQQRQPAQQAAQTKPSPAPMPASTLPAGDVVTRNRTNGSVATRESFFAIAKEHGLSNEAAKIASKYAKSQDWAAATAELNEQVKSFA
jgi:hypothetical protein